MDNILKFLKNYGAHIVAGVAVLWATEVYLYRRKKREVFVERVCGVDYPRDMVILHQVARERTIPSLGHFVVKLETYLRVNNIPYKVEFTAGTFSTGPKKKVPWIEYNGVTMGDSQLIIEFLNKEFNVDMDSHLTTLEKAQAWAIQKWIEEFVYWLNVHTKWNIFGDEMFEEGIPSFTPCQRKHIQKWAAETTYAVGIGRHSNEEVKEMVVYNLRQFAVLLGDKKFIMGDKMAVVDCAAFGILSEMRWATPSVCPGRKLFDDGEIPNVVKYLDRIKAECWPDWDSLKWHDRRR